MTKTVHTIYESRLLDGFTFRSTTGVQSIASGGTLSLHISHDGSDDLQYVISTTRFSSDGPVTVVAYDNPDSVSTGTALNIKNNSVGKQDDLFPSVNTYQGSTFTGADTYDAGVSGTETANGDGTVRGVIGGGGGEAVTSLVDSGDMMLELTNASSQNPHEMSITVVGLRV